MKIVMIGAGNLATNLALALQHSKHNVLQVYSRTKGSAGVLAKRLNCAYTTDLAAVTTVADIYVFSVKDTALEQLATDLCPRLPGKVFVHTAGSMPLSVFSSIADYYGVLYPMQTFSKGRELDFSTIPCFLEASDKKTLETLSAVAHSFTTNIVVMDSIHRRFMHLAAVWACNFVNHCYDVASELLKHQGLDFKLLLPLIDETAKKVHQLSPRQAQTGPAVRFDKNVIKMHESLMSEMPLQQGLYRKLSESIHTLTTNTPNDKL